MLVQLNIKRFERLLFLVKIATICQHILSQNNSTLLVPGRIDQSGAQTTVFVVVAAVGCYN